MNLVSVMVLSITGLLLVGVVIVTFIHKDGTIFSQETSGQVCCRNLTLSMNNNTFANNSAGISFAKGDIVSLQENEIGNLTWIASGTWNVSKTNSSEAGFNARFTMTKIDSTEKHRYRISDFNLKNTSVGVSSITINGIANVRLAAAAIPNVPISITVMDQGAGDETVKIWIDPRSVQNHFGKTPIYGTVSKLVR